MKKSHKKGIVIGKFYPLHKGHCYLIETALGTVEDLTILVCDNPAFKIPIEVRIEWIRELYPQAKVVSIQDIKDDDNSERWAKHTLSVLGYSPDVVLTSEEYGDLYAQYLGCKHILVDKKRVTIPISGTIIRKNPLATWDYLDPVVRAYFAKRVCIVGAESTGTTTLAKDLARHYMTTWVPEFGRYFYEGRITSKYVNEWKNADFTYIASNQNMNEDYFARSCNKILFCDTDALATSLWQKVFMRKTSSEVLELSKNRKYDLYLVTDIDIPYVDDGTRVGEERRHQMHSDFLELLKRNNKRFTIISGDKNERLSRAIELCDKLIVDLDTAYE